MTSTSISNSSQLDAIYSMMEEGQHSVKMERHSLLIWGITAAVLILITDQIFNLNTFSIRWQLIVSETVFISVILFFAGLWDLKLTRKLRQQRDESLSFIQLQLTKVWWFFVALIVLINVGMNFFGGGYMFYGLSISLIGMAFYIQGLFSTQMLKWIGAMLILLGLTSVALNLHFLVTKWLAAGVFGLGLPVLAFILDKPKTHSTLYKRFVLSFVWCALVIVPSYIAYKNKLDFNTEELNVLSVSEYMSLNKELAAATQIIHLPIGTEVPVSINMVGDLFEVNKTADASIKLTKALDVVIDNGKTTGHFRVNNMDWSKNKNNFRLRKFKMESFIKSKIGPAINISLKIN